MSVTPEDGLAQVWSLLLLECWMSLANGFPERLYESADTASRTYYTHLLLVGGVVLEVVDAEHVFARGQCYGWKGLPMAGEN